MMRMPSRPHPERYPSGPRRARILRWEALASRLDRAGHPALAYELWEMSAEMRDRDFSGRSRDWVEAVWLAVIDVTFVPAVRVWLHLYGRSR